jgi:hypothetical protein
MRRALLAPAWGITLQAASAQIAPTPTEAADCTGLHAAAWRGDVAAIDRLVRESQTALTTCDGRGRTPLHVLSFARQRDAARALMRAGAKPAALEHDRYDGTALIAAAHLGHDGVVRQLIAAGAPLDHVNKLH